MLYNERTGKSSMKLLVGILSIFGVLADGQQTAEPGERCDVVNVTITTPDCAVYYLCQTHSQIWVTRMCPYPDLFSTVSRKCETFLDVDCDGREVSLSPCGYLRGCSTNETGTCLCQHSHYPDVDWDFCINKADGRYSYPERLWSPFYINCSHGRTIPSVCKQRGNVIFDHIDRQCSLVYHVVVKHFGKNTFRTVPSELQGFQRSTYTTVGTKVVSASSPERPRTGSSNIVYRRTTLGVYTPKSSVAMTFYRTTPHITNGKTSSLSFNTLKRSSRGISSTNKLSTTERHITKGGVTISLNPGTSQSRRPTAKPDVLHTGISTAIPGKSISPMPTANWYTTNAGSTMSPKPRATGKPTAKPGTSYTDIPTAIPGKGISLMPTANWYTTNAGPTMPHKPRTTGNPTAKPAIFHTGIPTAIPGKHISPLPTAGPTLSHKPITTGRPTSTPGILYTGILTAVPGKSIFSIPTANWYTTNAGITVPLKTGKSHTGISSAFYTGVPTAAPVKGNSTMSTTKRYKTTSSNKMPGSRKTSRPTATPSIVYTEIPSIAKGKSISPKPTAKPYTTKASPIVSLKLRTSQSGRPTPTSSTVYTGIITDAPGISNSLMPPSKLYKTSLKTTTSLYPKTIKTGGLTAKPSTFPTDVPTAAPGKGNSAMSTAKWHVTSGATFSLKPRTKQTGKPTATPSIVYTDLPTAAPKPTAKRYSLNAGSTTSLNPKTGQKSKPTATPNTFYTEKPTASPAIGNSAMPTTNWYETTSSNTMSLLPGAGQTGRPTAKPHIWHTEVPTVVPGKGNSSISTAKRQTTKSSTTMSHNLGIGHTGRSTAKPNTYHSGIPTTAQGKSIPTMPTTTMYTTDMSATMSLSHKAGQTGKVTAEPTRNTALATRQPNTTNRSASVLTFLSPKPTTGQAHKTISTQEIPTASPGKDNSARPTVQVSHVANTTKLTTLLLKAGTRRASVSVLRPTQIQTVDPGKPNSAVPTARPGVFNTEGITPIRATQKETSNPKLRTNTYSTAKQKTDSSHKSTVISAIETTTNMHRPGKSSSYKQGTLWITSPTPRTDNSTVSTVQRSNTSPALTNNTIFNKINALTTRPGLNKITTTKIPKLFSSTRTNWSSSSSLATPDPKHSTEPLSDRMSSNVVSSTTFSNTFDSITTHHQLEVTTEHFTLSSTMKIASTGSISRVVTQPTSELVNTTSITKTYPTVSSTVRRTSQLLPPGITTFTSQYPEQSTFLQSTVNIGATVMSSKLGTPYSTATISQSVTLEEISPVSKVTMNEGSTVSTPSSSSNEMILQTISNILSTQKFSVYKSEQPPFGKVTETSMMSGHLVYYETFLPSSSYIITTIGARSSVPCTDVACSDSFISKSVSLHSHFNSVANNINSLINIDLESASTSPASSDSLSIISSKTFTQTASSVPNTRLTTDTSSWSSKSLITSKYFESHVPKSVTNPIASSSLASVTLSRYHLSQTVPHSTFTWKETISPETNTQEPSHITIDSSSLPTPKASSWNSLMASQTTEMSYVSSIIKPTPILSSNLHMTVNTLHNSSSTLLRRRISLSKFQSQFNQNPPKGRSSVGSSAITYTIITSSRSIQPSSSLLILEHIEKHPHRANKTGTSRKVIGIVVASVIGGLALATAVTLLIIKVKSRFFHIQSHSMPKFHNDNDPPYLCNTEEEMLY